MDKIIVYFCFLLLTSCYNIDYKVCQSSSDLCVTVAKFDSMEKCLSVKERQDWYCNSTNPKRIICTEEKSSLSRSYCE